MNDLALVESPKRQGMRSGTLRSRVELLLDSGFAASRLAVEAGLQLDALEAWRKGRILDEAEAKLGAWLIERDHAAAETEPDFIVTPTAERIFDALDEARNDPSLALIFGGSGVGKSRAAREYAAQLPSRTDPQNRAVLVTAGATCRRPSAILSAIVEALGVYGAAYRMQQMGEEIVRHLTPGDLLLIDEAQFLEADSLDALRFFLDEYGIGVGFFGNLELYTRFHGKGRAARFAQLDSRVGMRVEVKAPTETDVDLFLHAWGVSGRKEREFAHRLGAVAGGLRVLDRVMRKARAIARQTQRQIDIGILRAVAKHTGDLRL